MTQPITEESGVHNQWYEEAKAISTPKELAAFVTRLSTEYEHDYGTIAHAVAASAVAAANCMNHQPCGGITGFQAGAIMWEFITHWTHKPGDLLELMDHENLLYPQYDYRYGSVSPEVANELSKRAKAKLSESKASDAVTNRWREIAAGRFPVRVRGER